MLEMGLVSLIEVKGISEWFRVQWRRRGRMVIFFRYFAIALSGGGVGSVRLKW